MGDWLIKYLSAEFLIRNCANSGSTVFLRSLYISIIFYCIAITLLSITRENAVFSFSFEQLEVEVSSTIPWFGAIFAGVYAALYTRFSSQWNYLASLYNQMMSVRVSLSSEQKLNKDLVCWEAGFVEDAIDLHLAGKSMFAPMIKLLLETKEVRIAFFETAKDANTKFETLKGLLGIEVIEEDDSPSPPPS